MGIEKHLSITGTSSVSWKDAVVQAVAEASKTIDYLTSVRVVDQRAKIDGRKLIQYYVDLDLSFVIDRDRDWFKKGFYLWNLLKLKKNILSM